MKRGRYEIRAWAPSARAKRGEVLVRTMKIFSDDPHYAAVELYRLRHGEGGSRWRYEAIDHGAAGHKKLGAVISYADLVKRAGSRDPSRRAKRDAARRPPPLPSAEIRAMAAMLSRAGASRPAASARKLAEEGISPSELAWRMKVGDKTSRSKTRRKGSSRDPSESPVPKAMRVIRLYHEQGRTWETAAHLFMRNHPAMALDVMDRVGSYPSSDPELRALQKVW